MDTENMKIDFEKATLPLSQEVLKSGESWYIEYDADNEFLIFLKPYLENARELELKRMQRAVSANGGVRISESQYAPESFPPCVKNILSMGGCGSGATRALAFVASFMGQINMPEDEAREMWETLAFKWGATTANVFDSWFQKMNCPSCRTLCTSGSGYPHIDIAGIGACRPDMKCFKVNRSNPVYYVDKKLYVEKLNRDLFGG